jgi:3-phenylpropionate/trans-cinnamate dioxygenase ferredoxin reductase subunit
MSQHHHVKYLLVGGGLASSAAAQAIRAHDAEGAILLIGQENTRPYHRPPLSKEFLRGEISREQLFTDYPGWFSQNRIELHTGVRAVRLDADRKSVAFENGDEVLFDKLLLATGAVPRQLNIPGAKLPNVHYLRTLPEADRLHHAIEKAKNEGRAYERGGKTGPEKGRGVVTIVGGGLLGVELAATLSQVGLSVDLIVAAPHPWKRFAGEITGKFITRFLEQHGVRVHLNTEPDHFDGAGRVQRVVLTNGEVVPCDFVIPAIGTVINKDLLRGTSVAAEKAILVDAHCRTSIPDVYAAGDCAAIFDPLFGKHRVLDHADGALATGTLAGRNMAGVDLAYDEVNYFYSKIFDLSLSGWGEGKHLDRRILRGVPNDDSPDFIEFGVTSDGRIAQILAIGHTTEDDVLLELVKRRLQVAGREEVLKDPSANLRDLL